MRTLPTVRDMIRANRTLPDELKQSCLLLAFRKPIECYGSRAFLNIRFTPMMFAGGEDDYYMTHRVQEHRAGDQRCVWCHQTMKRTGLETYHCQTPNCHMIDKHGQPVRLGSSIGQWHGPVRGVIQAFVDPRFITHQVVRQNQPVDFCDRVLLMLDRRYRDEVLCAVYRTAGQICDEKGWRIR